MQWVYCERYVFTKDISAENTEHAQMLILYFSKY